MAEHLKNPTLSGGTYLYSVYKGVPPPPGTQMRVRSHTKLAGLQFRLRTAGCGKKLCVKFGCWRTEFEQSSRTVFTAFSV